MSLIPIGTPWSGPRKRPFAASASQRRASANTLSRSIVTHASTRDSMRSITRKSASTYSIGERVRAHTAAAASVSERSSGFIVDVQGHGSQFLEFRCELFDLRPQLFSASHTKFFFRGFLKIHDLSMLPFW